MRSIVLLVVTVAFCGAQDLPRRAVDPPPDPPNILLMKLQADPDNIQARRDLMNVYIEAGDQDAYLQQVLWLIANRSDSPLLVSREFLDTAGYARAKAAFELQLSKRADSPGVLYNAARFMERSDPVRSIDLLEQARKLAGSPSLKINYTRSEGWLYASAIPRDEAGKPTFPLTRQQADALQDRLTAISDPELLVATGQSLQGIPNDAARKLALQLMEKAVSLDPGNPKWQSALNRAKNGPQPPVVNGAVRIGGNVAEANLIQRVDPVYPPLAKSARVSGSVEFAATIDKEGAVQNLQLVRGHPLLVSAAKDAVQQWKYRPTLLNGSPVTVITDVIVNFFLTP